MLWRCCFGWLVILFRCVYEYCFLVWVWFSCIYLLVIRLFVYCDGVGCVLGFGVLVVVAPEFNSVVFTVSSIIWVFWPFMFIELFNLICFWCSFVGF